MKKIKMLSMMLVAVCAVSFAQDKKAPNNVTKVSKFEAGTSLTHTDIGFLDMVATGSTSTSRGQEKKEVMVDKSKFVEGQKLTKEEAALINKAIDANAKTNKDRVAKAPGEEKGPKGRCAVVCYYYYYDAYGNWVYYWYCC
jgi:hypothetical protein